ncbi:MAG TPA: SUMF1/EgtB/PvdO family nonheme iron enzyme [Fimbriimonas sp.]|nr:SUMF1/EgtB/PvdO family nonheme iron enzyme [Fimbriimonas sp.]
MIGSRKAEIASRLEAARKTTLELFEQVPDVFLRRRVHSFYSPIGWHFGHVGRTEEYWTCEATGAETCDERLSFLYADRPDNPKDNRINIPDRQGTLEYLERTRAVALRALAVADLDSSHPLLRDGYAWEFAIQHEYQHQETITEMLCLIHREAGSDGLAMAPTDEPSQDGEPKWIDIPAGTFMMGSDDLHGYDNEKRAHWVDVGPFSLANTPVTVAQWQAFMTDGGYHREQLWSAEGWAWKCTEDAQSPEYWVQLPAGDWACYGMFGLRTLNREEPAMCLSWFEADAFARWAGKRLPTEIEWEFAASGLVERHFPWGDNQPSDTMATYGRHERGPRAVWSCPKGASPFGALDMAGNCWEWTSSKFMPYPGFEPFPYEGYSKDHMGGKHYVCRGGSWATSAPILRCSFRNWYVPGYRQGFLGVRLAADA